MLLGDGDSNDAVAKFGERDGLFKKIAGDLHVSISLIDKVFLTINLSSYATVVVAKGTRPSVGCVWEQKTALACRRTRGQMAQNRAQCQNFENKTPPNEQFDGVPKIWRKERIEPRSRNFR